MNYNFKSEKNTLIISLDGRLDSSSTSEFEKALSENFTENIQNIIFDFEKTDYISSAGIRILFLYQRLINKRSGEMKIINVNNVVMDIFELTGTSDVITVEQKSDDLSPVRLYMFSDIANGEYNCKVLENEFHKLGYSREIKFDFWNSFNSQPPLDGDVYCYDATALSAMASSGLIRPLPDSIFNEDIFEWIADSTLYKKVRYGIPFISCASLLFCRKDKYNGEKCVFDLKGSVATPLKSMMASYYLFALCANLRNSESDNEDRFFSQKAFKTIEKLFELIGGKNEFENSRFSTFDGMEKFKKGEKDFYIGFGEDLRFLDTNEYCVNSFSFSDNTVGTLLFPTNVVSVSSKVSGNKLNECLAIAKIIGSTDYQRKICIMNGIAQYMFATSKKLYSELCEKYPPYTELYNIISNEENKVNRFGDDFFELLPVLEKTLWSKIENL